MKKLLYILFLCGTLNLCAENDVIEELKVRISCTENFKSELIDSSDIYSYYYHMGKQAAYHECIELLIKNDHKKASEMKDNTGEIDD